MRWDTINHVLAELPDTVVLALSEQVRQEISTAEPDTCVHGEDQVFAGAQASDWRSVDGELDPHNVREILAYRDLQLGWKIARECAKRRIPLPGALAWDGEAIYRAYLYQLNPKRFPDKGVQKALFWKTKAMQSVANDIEAMLVCPDTTPESVADSLKLDVEHIRVYEHLFFNISSRKEDALWLRYHVYPNTRMVEFFDGYTKSVSFQQLLKRAGLKNGADHVMQLAGIATEPLDAMAAATSAAQLESFLLSTGLLMAQNGWGNENSATAIFHSRHLMTASKMGGEDTQAGAEYMNMADTLWDEMIRIKRPQAHQALIKQNIAQGKTIDVDAEVL